MLYLLSKKFTKFFLNLLIFKVGGSRQSNNQNISTGSTMRVLEAEEIKDGSFCFIAARRHSVDAFTYDNAEAAEGQIIRSFPENKMAVAIREF